METDWILDRSHLWQLHLEHPDWGAKRLSRFTERSLTWVKKWLRRLRGADPDDESVLHSRSRARKTSPKKVCQTVIDRILAIRDEPPGNLRRTPGPKTILYYLGQDEELQQQNVYLPRSTRTIWQILRQHGRIFRQSPPDPEPEERPEPMSEWGIDFKDVSTVPAEPDGRRQHGVEAFNVIDHGTSILLSAQVRQDYTMVTAVEAMVYAFRVHGRPRAVRFDRDPRFVGSWSAGEFPSAFMRLLMCLDIQLQICPPRRPDKNPFIERYHRNYKYECLLKECPETLAQAQAVTMVYEIHYNIERPSQAITCGNQPPRVTFPELPSLPPLPEQVDPDRWLDKIHGQFYKRRIQANGSVQVGKQYYYIRKKLKGHRVLLQVDALARQFQVLLDGRPIKRLNVKGLFNGVLDFDAYFDLIRREAESEWQQYLRRRRYSHL
jgi:transposase InsO family protein